MGFRAMAGNQTVTTATRLVSRESCYGRSGRFQVQHSTKQTTQDLGYTVSVPDTLIKIFFALGCNASVTRDISISFDPAPVVMSVNKHARFKTRYLDF